MLWPAEIQLNLYAQNEILGTPLDVRGVDHLLSFFDEFDELMPAGGVSLRMCQHLAPVTHGAHRVYIATKFHITDHLPPATNATRDQHSHLQWHALRRHKHKFTQLKSEVPIILPKIEEAHDPVLQLA